MSDAWVGVVSTALGAAIGAFSSVATMVVQSRRQSVQEMKKTAVQIALEDYHFRINDKTHHVAPLSASVLIFYYDRLIDLATNGQLDRPHIQRLLRDQFELQVAVDEEGKRLQAARTATTG
jgi:AraC-like DNA-binding protein